MPVQASIGKSSAKDPYSSNSSKMNNFSLKFFLKYTS